MKRPGTVTVELLREGNTLVDIRIGGRALIVVRGEIEAH